MRIASIPVIILISALALVFSSAISNSGPDAANAAEEGRSDVGSALARGAGLAAFHTGAGGLHPRAGRLLDGARPADDSLYVADGLEATLWAEAPMFYNPTNIDVDARGRLWVLETVDYRNFNNPAEEHLTHPQGERIMILDDTDGDGKADASKVFVQDEDLVAPLGIAVLGNKVYVSHSPHLYVYTDTDGDDRSDKRETFLTGFGGLDHDHGLHAIVGGPDGRLYFNAGNAGPHIVTDNEGWMLRSGSIYSGGSPYMQGNQPGLVSDDGRIWPGGIQLRIRPDGTGLEVLADNFRNSYEVAVDSYGNLWNNDNDDDGNAGTRVLWTMEGSNTGYFSEDGSRRWQIDRRPGQDPFRAQWHQDDPGVIPAGDPTGPGAPTGIVYYESDALGDDYRGTLLSADAGRNIIYGYHPEPQGAGFRMEHFSFFSTLPPEITEERETYQSRAGDDTRYLFRPSDVAVGTDGSVYVADWYDPRVGGHDMHEMKGYGRIFRITPKGRSLEEPRIDLSTTEGQIDALLNPAQNVRYQGFTRLVEQGEAVVDDVEEILESDNPFHRARAVWLLAQLGDAGVETVEDVLESGDSDLQVTAFRALRQVWRSGRVLEKARMLADDPSPAVRREVAIFLRDVPLAESRDMMLDLARSYEPGDRWMLEAIGLAAEGEETEAYDVLSEEFGDEDPTEWSEAWADIAWRLHPLAAVGDFRERAASSRIEADQKRRALTAIGFVADPKAMKAMEALAASADEEVSSLAEWWLDFRSTNDWRPFKDWGEPDDPERREELAALKALEADVLDADATEARRLEAASKLADSREGGQLLTSLILTDRLPERMAAQLGDSLLSSRDRTVRVLIRSLYDVRGEDISAGAVAAMEGDAQRGRMTFYAKCAVCHSVNGVGADVGPDLTGTKNMFNREALADAIINPGGAIAHGYTPTMIRTSGGEVVYGFLLAENPETLIVKDDRGQRHVIGKERVAETRTIEHSLMPGPEDLQLDEQSIADLVEFLETTPN